MTLEDLKNHLSNEDYKELVSKWQVCYTWTTIESSIPYLEHDIVLGVKWELKDLEKWIKIAQELKEKFYNGQQKTDQERQSQQAN
jgi:hypothetical protein